MVLKEPSGEAALEVTAPLISLFDRLVPSDEEACFSSTSDFFRLAIGRQVSTSLSRISIGVAHG